MVSPAHEASSRRSVANRANAQKSTGPRTAAGKTRSRGNATRHGLRAELPPEQSPRLVAVIEDPQAYAALHRAFVDDLRPRGAAEQFLAERMARAAWRVRHGD